MHHRWKPNSAVTGRSIEEIAEQEDHVWNSKETARGEAWYRQEPRAKPEPEAREPASEHDPKLADLLKSLPKKAQPSFLKPQLALR